MQLQYLNKLFPDLSETQKQQFIRLLDVFPEWNEKINCVSRTDIRHLEEKHVLHSASISKIAPFEPGTRVLDLGTGGGFPGIPSAILNPDVEFLLVDSIGKKIRVVENLIEELELENAIAKSENVGLMPPQPFDRIISRAVAQSQKLLNLTKHFVRRKKLDSNGYYFLKGGDLSEEIQNANIKKYTQHKLSALFPDLEFYETKLLLEIPFQQK